MTVTIDAKHLADTHTFAALRPETVQAIAEQAGVSQLHDGVQLFAASEPYKQAIYIIYTGEMEMLRADGSVRRQGPGAILGLSNYLDQEAYTSTVTSLGDSTVLELSDATLGRLETEHPDLSTTLNRIISNRLRNRSRLRHRISGSLGKPVSSVMKAPLISCVETDSLRSAFTRMQHGNIGSLGVLDSDGHLLGVLTYASLAKALLEHPATADQPIDTAILETPVKVPAGLPLWQADELQINKHLKYLIVVDGNQPLGIISKADILRAFSVQRSILLTDIREADSVEKLKQLHDELPGAVREIWESHRRATQAVRVISELHLALQRRCAELTEARRVAEGRGQAPRAFTLLIMGSGGRGEMLLGPDQDNGIIIEDQAGPLRTEESQWFESFSEELNLNLDRIGYPLCPGDIMARNPRFRKTSRQWREQISYLVEHPNEKAARWSSIVFDFAPLVGDAQLSESLRYFLLEKIKHKPRILEFMAEQDAEGRPALGFFNRLVTAEDELRKGKIDLKRNGLRIVCDAARIFSLAEGISAGNTLDRLNALVRQGVLDIELVASVSLAFEEILDLLLAHQLGQLEHGQEVNNLLDPETLSAEVRSTLRMAMRAIKRFQDVLQGRFGREAL